MIEETIIRIDDETIQKTTVETIVTEPCHEEYQRLLLEIEELEKQPDEIIVPNTAKTIALQGMMERKCELQILHNIK